MTRNYKLRAVGPSQLRCVDGTVLILQDLLRVGFQFKGGMVHMHVVDPHVTATRRWYNTEFIALLSASQVFWAISATRNTSHEAVLVPIEPSYPFD